jgi:predicted nucleic acid-binding protein
LIVVDANILLYSVVPGPLSLHAHRVYLRDPEWAAPPLWRSEFRNVLARSMREQGLKREHALVYLERAGQAVGPRERPPSSSRVLDLALDSGCSAYDCEFVALAEALEVPLVTNDGEVLRKFPGIAVSMEEFGGTRGG